MTIVTTSWDDGHPLDLRLGDMLSRYGLKGTFYVPLSSAHDSVMSPEQIRALRTMGMEIGSHTLTHPILTGLSRNDALGELLKSRQELERIIEEPVVSFCYPKGKFNRRVTALTAQAGYGVARTTIGFRVDTAFDALLMPVSFQFFPHGRGVHIKHGLREGNLKGLLSWMGLWGAEYEPVKLADLMFGHVLKQGGVIHIWGHSWEIESVGLWGELEEVFQSIGRRREVLYLTNSQVVGALSK